MAVKAVKLKGTKERIFDVAIQLFATEGYEDVSMRDIAGGVGIHVSSLYNHYASKEEMLEAIYQYYGIHRFDNRNADRLVKETIESGSALEVVRVLSEMVIEADRTKKGKKMERMYLIPRVILMRIYQDEKANQFFLHNWYKLDVERFKKWLGYAVEIGRLRKDFDIETFSVFLWQQFLAMGICASADPDYEVRRLSEEERLLKMLARLLPLRDQESGIRDQGSRIKDQGKRR